ncbi:MAG: Holliday junction branch migration DNA helicase RuvB [Alphaproteobacteria bacterium]|jgi:Holliday junction DNA helicase RuvB|nr:Holliday junction branch migration DNA helicase RuvB [Alphaproteobacteria bacterium]
MNTNSFGANSLGDSRLVSADLDNNEADITVRPPSLKDFIGQKGLKDNLEIFIEASKHRGEALDHILFYGPPGLGKTTLSQIIATEMGVGIKYISGPAISKQGDLAAIITNLEPGGVLFIDEIHRLPISVEEILYSAMEDYKIDFIVGEGPTARSLRIDLPKFTLVGATTRYGLLSAPLRDRFGITLQLQFYDDEELASIISRSADILKLKINNEGTNEIARRSRGTPRIANRLLRRIRDFLTVSSKNVIDGKLANEALQKLGVDENGLDEMDRKYLKSIIDFYDGGPVGIDTIATVLSESKDTIEDTVEPFLIQKGYVNRTTRGRIITTKGWSYFNLNPKKIDLFT